MLSLRPNGYKYPQTGVIWLQENVLPLRRKGRRVLILSVSLVLLSWTLLSQDLVKYIHVLYHISLVTLRYVSSERKREQGGASEGPLHGGCPQVPHHTLGVWVSARRSDSI